MALGGGRCASEPARSKRDRVDRVTSVRSRHAVAARCVVLRSEGSASDRGGGGLGRKTTSLSCCPFSRPQPGNSADGVPLPALQRASLRRARCVSQEPWGSNDTLAPTSCTPGPRDGRSIDRPRRRPTRRIIAICRMDYQRSGDNGHRLSGGQRQRSHARSSSAIRPPAPRRATSALDTNRGMVIIDRPAEQDRTVLVVAHRLATVSTRTRSCDDAGPVARAERGAGAENGLYRRSTTFNSAARRLWRDDRRSWSWRRRRRPHATRAPRGLGAAR